MRRIPQQAQTPELPTPNPLPTLTRRQRRTQRRSQPSQMSLRECFHSPSPRLLALLMGLTLTQVLVTIVSRPDETSIVEAISAPEAEEKPPTDAPPAQAVAPVSEPPSEPTHTYTRSAFCPSAADALRIARRLPSPGPCHIVQGMSHAPTPPTPIGGRRTDDPPLGVPNPQAGADRHRQVAGVPAAPRVGRGGLRVRPRPPPCPDHPHTCTPQFRASRSQSESLSPADAGPDAPGTPHFCGLGTGARDMRGLRASSTPQARCSSRARARGGASPAGAEEARATTGARRTRGPASPVSLKGFPPC